MPYSVVTTAAEGVHRIFYKKFGDDNAPHKLIFTMGLGGDHEQWEPQSRFFIEHDDCQVLVYDNRGVGFSDPVTGRWTTKSMAKDALCLLNNLGWHNDVHIIGLSMGGMISQELALLDLKRFKSLTLISTISGGIESLGLFVWNIPTGIKTLASTFGTTNPRQQLKNGLKLLYPEEFLNQITVHEETGEEETYFRKLKRALIQRGVRTRDAGMPPTPISSVVKQAFAVMTHRISNENMRKMSRHFRDAALVITGDSDILVHPQNSATLRSGLRAKLLILPLGGHGANEQFPEKVNEKILENILIGSNQASSQSKM
uniref:AB hydrolase-1 domain-containing protein n=1 Tax=Aplanochytrium stocchinoi TaxID=215587 RepID=A0A7S3LMD7_9STRA|mmetsp:Transcript_24483/g.29907  ORF Transcript_24483/g.29907 Transcript_24483/m.29907 type:complete len:315 (+) Transcript_24483:105-1049(+)|eukprot:CAMPEP_0204834222 /NCGR_PEP_ID=MMETSP1346-20131115/19159_1 /ASSEMBLY_ACC=CAM_ASM_000771 /TAXON_ID=215587 /ORGANISM="Aplanochytrium stocchinoi, Strain GSBS06" /LENGTH=314 /DNA_ID=CAMNT_0051967371 /DNA_START=66 /DNA_END=1010 /DNA_ORIENTATION=-